MEERLARAILDVFKNHFNKYLSAIESKTPSSRLPNFYTVFFGDYKKIDGMPCLIITPTGWNKSTPEISYHEAMEIENVYRYQLTILIEGNDPFELEIRMMRYREAVIECLRDHYLLGGVALGSIISSADNYNLAAGGGANLILGTRMNLEVYSLHFDPDLIY